MNRLLDPAAVAQPPAHGYVVRGAAREQGMVGNIICTADRCTVAIKRQFYRLRGLWCGLRRGLRSLAVSLDVAKRIDDIADIVG